MAENDIEQLRGLKGVFDGGTGGSGETLNSDQKTQLATQIAQREFVFNCQSNQGKRYIEKALNYPPALRKTYPSVSERPKMVAMATYAVLESMHSGIFVPSGDNAAIMIIDVQRYADRLEKKPALTIMEFKDILFARFISAIFGVTAFINEKRRDEAVDDLQRTISSLPKRFTDASGEIAEREHIQELIRLFNSTNRGLVSILEGRPVALIDAVFRSYQNLPLATKQ